MSKLKDNIANAEIMTEQTTITSKQIQVSFANVEGVLPSYANVTLVNLITSDVFILDFGFLDPLTVTTGKVDSNNQYPLKSVGRVLLTREIAEQLSSQLSSMLNQNFVDT
jgi:hypothetical protein